MLISRSGMVETMLDVCLLGTSGMMPLPRRALTALMTRFNGSSLLIDCGEGTQITIRAKGWSLHDVDLLCILFFVPLRGFVQCLFIILRHDQLPSMQTDCPDLYMHMHIFVSLILTWKKKFVQCDSMFEFSMYYLC